MKLKRDSSGQRREGKRTPEEIRSLLLKSAREVFSSRGFAGASTREIADRADVSETLLFRHFGSKSMLFEKAIAEPVVQFINGWVVQWEAQEEQRERRPQTAAVTFSSGLYQVLRENHEAVIAFLAASAHDKGQHGGLSGKDSAISETLDRLEVVVQRHHRKWNFHKVNAAIFTRIAFGIVFALAVFDEELFPRGSRHPSERAILNEVVAILMYGITHRP